MVVLFIISKISVSKIKIKDHLPNIKKIRITAISMLNVKSIQELKIKSIIVLLIKKIKFKGLF